jgi:hypothetical protein
VKAATQTDERILTNAAVFFALTVVFHNGDHLRRGVHALSHDVFALGTLGIFVEVGVVVLICMRHRFAPLAAMVAGATLAVGYLFVHFLPARAWLSDSFISHHVSPLSIAAASMEIFGAVYLVMAGAMTYRRGSPPPPEGERTLAEAVRDPLVVLFGLSQVVVLAVSFAQLL